ncbi:Acyl-coenzyme A thioesterase 9, mitochondrial [Balamuthia mandrillaris]
MRAKVSDTLRWFPMSRTFVRPALAAASVPRWLGLSGRHHCFSTATTTTSTRADRPAKQPRDSLVEDSLAFGSDLELREGYLNSFGNIRLGMVLEDLDGFAGKIAYKHTEGQSTPVHTVGVHNRVPTTAGSAFNTTIVTAAVDRIQLINPIRGDRDLKMKGLVTWVGKSSMEVRAEVYSVMDDETNVLPHMLAHFVMVARTKDASSALVVPALQPVTPEERRRFEQGAINATYRKEAANTSLMRLPPRPEEVSLIHNFFMQQHWRSKMALLSASSSSASSSPVHRHYVLMSDTGHSSTQWTHPQNRNIHGNIYGGFLMRQAFELAFASCGMFAKERPEFVSMDDIHFIKPVRIGSILSFHCNVVYTAEDKKEEATKNEGEGDNEEKTFPLIQMRVQANVCELGSDVEETTNVFHITFRCNSNKKQILPNTYGEAMEYLHGRRRLLRAQAAKEDLTKELDNFGRL